LLVLPLAPSSSLDTPRRQLAESVATAALARFSRNNYLWSSWTADLGDDDCAAQVLSSLFRRREIVSHPAAAAAAAARGTVTMWPADRRRCLSDPD